MTICACQVSSLVFTSTAVRKVISCEQVTLGIKKNLFYGEESGWKREIPSMYRPEAIVPKNIAYYSIHLIPCTSAVIPTRWNAIPIQIPIYCKKKKVYAAQCSFLPTGGGLRFSWSSLARSDGIGAHSHARNEMLGGEDWVGYSALSWAECTSTCAWLGVRHLCVCLHVADQIFPKFLPIINKYGSTS